jgi:quinol monooxygenase YgiN
VIIVSGSIHVDPADRDTYLSGCRSVIEQARQAPGCVDFHLSADPLDDGRINVYEQWDTVAAVEAFRGSGPGDDQSTAIQSAAVFQHHIASSQAL